MSFYPVFFVTVVMLSLAFVSALGTTRIATPLPSTATSQPLSISQTLDAAEAKAISDGLAASIEVRARSHPLCYEAEAAALVAVSVGCLTATSEAPRAVATYLSTAPDRVPGRERLF